jgi:hypothetical protein
LKKIRIFLFKIAILAGILVGSYFLFAYILTRGFVGDDYPKFTHASSNLVLGLSRAHFGMDPATISKVLSPLTEEDEMLNFAFEKSQSPYGEVYLQAIKRKLKTPVKDGVFLLCVSPGSFSVPNRLKTEKEILAFDQQMMIGKVKNLNAHPNFEYVRKCFGRSLYKGILPHDHRVTTVFHDNGWEEFRLKAGTYEIDQEQIKSWQDETVKGYSKIVDALPEYISEYRIKWFRKTIEELKIYGKVYIVRLPIHKGVLGLEDRVWKDFDSEMSNIASDFEVGYLNYARTGEKYQTYDGSHLYSASAIKLSRDVALEILRRNE